MTTPTTFQPSISTSPAIGFQAPIGVGPSVGVQPPITKMPPPLAPVVPLSAGRAAVSFQSARTLSTPTLTAQDLRMWGDRALSPTLAMRKLGSALDAVRLHLQVGRIG